MKITDQSGWRRPTITVCGIPLSVGEFLLLAALCVAGSVLFGFTVRALLSVAVRLWGGAS